MVCKGSRKGQKAMDTSCVIHNGAERPLSLPLQSLWLKSAENVEIVASSPRQPIHPCGAPFILHGGSREGQQAMNTWCANNDGVERPLSLPLGGCVSIISRASFKSFPADTAFRSPPWYA